MGTLYKFVGTFGFTGYFPIAPATFASAIFAAIYWLVPGGTIVAHPIVCVITAVVSIPVSTQLEKIYDKTDPGRIVIDEVVGFQVILVGARDISGIGLIVAFFLFRFFDIAKPFPVRRSQKLPRGWGVVIDDVLAGIYTRTSLVLLAFTFDSLNGFI